MAEEKQVSKSLPSISALFKESWETLKGSALNLFLLYLISFGLFAGLFIVGALITIPLGAFSIFSAIQNNQLNPAFFTSLSALGIVILILIIVAVVINLAVSAAMIMAVANYKTKQSVGEMLKKGFSLALPLFLANIIVGFITAGGYFLFIIPGIVFSIALSFTSYEIVLQQKSPLAAMRRSMGIVFSNFWGILGRMLLYLILAILAMFIPQIISSTSQDSNVATGVSLISFIVQIGIGWYGIAYSYTLYKQASLVVPNKTGKLLLPTILAIIGWIIGVLMIIAITAAIATLLQNINPASLQKNLPNQAQIEALQKYQKDPNSLTEQDMRALLELLPKDSPERAQFEEAIRKQFEGDGMMQDDSMMDGTMMPTGIPNSY